MQARFGLRSQVDQYIGAGLRCVFDDLIERLDLVELVGDQLGEPAGRRRPRLALLIADNRQGYFETCSTMRSMLQV